MIIKEVNNIQVSKNDYNNITVEFDLKYDEEVINEDIQCELVVVSETTETTYSVSLNNPVLSSSAAQNIPTSPRTNMINSYYKDLDVYIEDVGGQGPLQLLATFQGRGPKKQFLLAV